MPPDNPPGSEDAEDEGTTEEETTDEEVTEGETTDEEASVGDSIGTTTGESGGMSTGDESTASGAEDTTLATITHILALFTWVIGPVVVLLVSEDEFVRENARNAINWQIFMTIYTIIGLILTLVVVGVFILLLVGLLDLIFCVVAAVKANEGEAWSYPLTLDLV